MYYEGPNEGGRENWVVIIILSMPLDNHYGNTEFVIFLCHSTIILCNRSTWSPILGMPTAKSIAEKTYPICIIPALSFVYKMQINLEDGPM